MANMPQSDRVDVEEHRRADDLGAAVVRLRRANDRVRSMTAGMLALRYDQAVAVIGDIHGRADLLERLLQQLGELPILVIGDLGDRGPDTRGVLKLLVSRRAKGVLGNHDVWLREWANHRGFDSMALSPMMAGAATLRSYGCVGTTPRELDAEAWRVPREHAQLLDSLVHAIDLEVAGERYWLVHAGISASAANGLPAEEVVPHCARHRPGELLWGFTRPEQVPTLDRPVIMGHTPVARAIDLGHVLAIDTGSGTLTGGRLTAVVLPGRRFVSAG